MIEKKIRSPSSGEDSANNVLDETINSSEATEEPDSKTSEIDRPPTYKLTHGPNQLSSNRNKSGADQTENSDGGTSSSTSTLSTSSIGIGRRSKSRDSRHSSEEVIGEEDSDAELSEDNKDVGHPASIFELADDTDVGRIKNDKSKFQNGGKAAAPGIAFTTSSDVDSAFEDQPLVGHGHRSKKKIKQRKSSRKSAKSSKPMKSEFESSSSIPMSKSKESLKNIFPFLPCDETRECHFKDRPGELALFNLEISPSQEGSPLMMEEVGAAEILLYDPPPSNNESLMSDHRRVKEFGVVGMDKEGNSLTMGEVGKYLMKTQDCNEIDPHFPNGTELGFLSHLEDKGEVDEVNPPLPLTTQEISNDHDVSRQQYNQSGRDSTIEMKTEEAVEYDVEWVPPDGGWGWMVLFGSIIVNILIPGTVKSFGVLFIEFLEVFNATPAAASWIPALSYWLYSSTGPFATALAIKYSHRSVTIAGGILAAAGLMLSYFATSIEYLYISYGLIGGLGAGLAYPIGVIMVGQYFRKRIGLANGLCTSGSALGSVVMPPLLRFLLSEYDYRGAILIMGAILLNVCVAAMFYDPVDKHLKKVMIPRVKTAQPVTANGVTATSRGKSLATTNLDIGKTGPTRGMEMAMSMPIAIPPMPDKDVRDRRGSGSMKKATFHIGNETPTADSWSLRSGEGASPLASRLLKDDPGSPRMYHNSNLRTRPFPCSLESTSEMERLFNMHLATSTQPSNAASRSKLNLTAIPEDDDQATSDCESRNMDWSYYRNLTPTKQRLMRLNAETGNQVVTASSSQPHNMNRNSSFVRSGLSRTLSVASNVSNSSFHYVSTIHHGSLLMTMQYDKSMPEFASTLTLKSVRHSCWSCWIDFPKRLLRKCGLCPQWTADTTDHQVRTPKKGPESWKRFIDLSLLKDGIFIVILLSSATTAIGYTNFIILLPSYALHIGFDKSDASILLSIVAAFDFVGRIGGAALSDLIVKQRKWFYIMGLLGSGIALALLPVTKSYWPLVSFCGAFGLTSGIYIGVTAVILADILGIDRLGSSYGITLFLNGIVQLAGPPICGALLEYFKSFDQIFVGLGIILILGAAMWIFMPFIERHRRRQLEEDEMAIDVNSGNLDEKQLQHLAVRRLKEADAV